MNNPLLTEAIGSVVRWILALGAGYLVEHGIWTQADAALYVSAATLALLSIGLSLAQKYRARLKLLVALSLQRALTETAVEQVVTSGATLPPVTTPKNVVPTPADVRPA